jgi:hypothetical protein
MEVAPVESLEEELPLEEEQPEEELPLGEAPPMEVLPMEELEELLARHPMTASRPRPRLQQLTSLPHSAVTVYPMLGLLRLDGAVMGFVAYDCFSASNRVYTYSR